MTAEGDFGGRSGVCTVAPGNARIFAQQAEILGTARQTGYPARKNTVLRGAERRAPVEALLA